MAWSSSNRLSTASMKNRFESSWQCIREVGAKWHSYGKIDPTLRISNRLSWYLAGILKPWQCVYSIMQCKHIQLYSWDIEKTKKYGIGPFCPDPGAKWHTLCHFAPNGLFHCIKAVQAVFWLIRLINLRLAQAIVPAKNNYNTKSKYS